MIIEVTRFDGELGGRCVLQARWRVLGHRGAPPTVHGQSSLSEPAGGDYAALVAAQSRLLGALSAEIARAIRGATRAGITAPSFGPKPFATPASRLTSGRGRADTWPRSHG